ncbi:MAG: GAF domain-containing protein [Deltaproteobacteria bacterium]|nr:GAF domain-containing protein [Deltaproteobacteria bacterium]
MSNLTGKSREFSVTSALSAVADLLTAPKNSQDIYDLALGKVLEALDLRHGNLRLINPVTGELELMASKGFPSEYTSRFRSIKIGERSAGKVVRLKGPVVWDNIQTDPSYSYLHLRKEGVNSMLGVPLLSGDGVIGTLSVSSHDRGRFGEEEVQLLCAIGRVLGVSIENAHLLSVLKKSINDLTKLTLRLEESDGIKDRLLSVISHELRTPVTIILSNTELLAERMFGEINERQRNSLLTVRASGARLLYQIENAIDVAQLEGGEESVHPEPVSVGDIRGKMLELLGDEIERKNLDVFWEIDPDVPSLFTDQAKLIKIFRNLIDNAIKFTEAGHVKVRVTYQKDMERVQCEVEDTGTGIPKEQFEVIFDPFHQVDSSHTRLYGGMGLGLRYVKRTLELLNGGIKVASEVGEGSVFTFWFPAQHGRVE